MDRSVVDGRLYWGNGRPSCHRSLAPL